MALVDGMAHVVFILPETTEKVATVHIKMGNSTAPINVSTTVKIDM